MGAAGGAAAGAEEVPFMLPKSAWKFAAGGGAGAAPKASQEELFAAAEEGVMESNPAKGSAAACVVAAAELSAGTGADAVFGFLLDEDFEEEEEEVLDAAALFGTGASLSHQALSKYFILIQERKCCKSLLLCGAFILSVRGSYRARYLALTASFPELECCNLATSSAVKEE